MSEGIVVWITGLSGAGKSVIAQRVVNILLERGRHCILLDGDEMRQAFPDAHSGYDRESRLVNARRNSGLAKLLADQGLTVIFATMSLFSEIQEWNRENFPAYLEVFVDVPLRVLEERDSNGLYSRARQNLADNVVGIDLEYDIPARPDLVVDNSGDIAQLDIIAQEISGMVR